MGWWNPFKEVVSNTKPLFLAVYATVLLGIVFSSVYVVSSIYMAKPSSFVLPSPASSGETYHVDHSSSLFKFESMLTRPIWSVPSAGSKMPSLGEFGLTKSMVESRAKRNVIIITLGNYAFMDFITNWVEHLTELNVSNLLVGAMDHKLLEALYWKGVPVFDMGSNMNTVDVGWGSPTFHKMGREKVILINAILPFGYELLMCDTDMVWLKDPLPYFARFPEADILTSSDQVIPTVADDKLEVWQEVSGAYNIGIFHWRPTNASIKLARQWMEMLLADEKIWDQNGFNELMQKSWGPSVSEDSGLVYAFDGSLKLGILPASIFCSGHTYFVQAMYQQFRLEPYAVHTTFQFAGTEGKRHRLREAMLFHDPPEYYDSPGGFLSFKPNIPKRLLLDGNHTVESHFVLVNYQLKQIRTALAIALLLNRTLLKKISEKYNHLCQAISQQELARRMFASITKVVVPSYTAEEIFNVLQVAAKVVVLANILLASSRCVTKQSLFFVMPPLWCRLDRLWFDHPGILPGTMTRQPFLCPMDHVFEVNIMLKKLPEEEFGPRIDFREYSFLENPRTPKLVKDSQLHVELCDEKSAGCVINDRSQGELLKFPRHSSEETLKSVFSAYKDVKVLQFSSVMDALQGFTDKIMEQKFRNRVKRYVGIWCCMMSLERGHIYYDMYWDEKPDWKPVPPSGQEDDHPLW